jgi:hypothetical protein
VLPGKPPWQANLDPSWAALVVVMVGYNKLPIRDAATAQTNEASADWRTITSDCASVGITIAQ